MYPIGNKYHVVVFFSCPLLYKVLTPLRIARNSVVGC